MYSVHINIHTHCVCLYIYTHYIDTKSCYMIYSNYIILYIHIHVELTRRYFVVSKVRDICGGMGCWGLV